MKIYLMRHGRTNWNEKNITQGRRQNQLSRTGKKEVMKIAKNFADTKIDLIVASPLMRTMQTAKLINEFHHVEIIKDERLIEVDQGIFSGRRYSSLSEEEKQLKKARSKDCHMESWKEVYERMVFFLDGVKMNYPYENILVITHEAPAIYIDSILTNKKLDFDSPFSTERFLNAEIREYEI